MSGCRSANKESGRFSEEKLRKRLSEVFRGPKIVAKARKEQKFFAELFSKKATAFLMLT